MAAQRDVSDRALTFLLAGITAVAPLLMQIYLPALPSISRALGSDVEATQLTFSAFVFTVGIAQLVYGPVSDRFGRRNTVLASLALTLVGSIFCALAQSIGQLIAARMIQAAGAAGGIVVSRAILSDRYGISGMAARLSGVIAIIVIVPMIAPLIGGYLTDWYGWRATFIACAAFIGVVIAVSAVLLPETRARAERTAPLLAGAGTVLRKPLFLLFTLQAALSLCIFYAFISTVPYLLATRLGLPATVYGQFFILLAGAYLAGTIISSRIASRAGLLAMIRIGTLLGLVGGIALFGLTAALPLSPWTLFGPMALLAMANGIASPSMQSGAVLQSQRYAGTASGIVGSSQQLLAGAAVQLVTLGGLDSPLPMTGFILAAALVTAAITVTLPRLMRPQPPDRDAATS